jgi:cytochrome c oxidase subunit 2
VFLASTKERIRDIKGETLNYLKQSKSNATYFALFGIVLTVGLFYCFKYYEFSYFTSSASDVGVSIFNMFVVTTVISMFVFLLCHFLLFWFVLKYKETKDGKAYFFSHSNKLEIIWTSVPALVLTVLVVMGISTWFEVFPNEKNSPKAPMQVEVTGKQFNWIVRYPGPDGILGKRLITKENVTPENELGIDFSDPHSHDDFFASEIHMVKEKPINFNLSALDVLHSFYLPHFNVKMDCVPGIPTGIGFKPIKTTLEERENLKKLPFWQEIDPNTSEPRYKNFNFELACAELCGKSHYGMQMNVIVEDQAGFDAWAKSQKPIYSGQAASNGLTENVKEFDIAALSSGTIDTSITYATSLIEFSSGSAELNAKSKVTLDQLAELLKKNNNKLILEAHTDSDGEDKSNLSLSQKRADACKAYLLSKGVGVNQVIAIGMGESQPLTSNDTPEGKQKNRRTEFKFN